MLDIAEAVYRDRLGPRDTARMIADDNDHGEKLRNRAKCYLPLVIPFAKALGVDLAGAPLPAALRGAEAFSATTLAPPPQRGA